MSRMKSVVRGGIHTLSRSPWGRVAKSWLLGHRYNPAKTVFRGADAPVEIVVYFGETSDKLYQLEQWLPSFAELHTQRGVLLVFRDYTTMLAVGERSDLPLAYVPDYHSLIELYDAHDFTVVFYVNNGMKNFQSLSHPVPVHIHLDHGESDKTSSISNQVKAYDKLFVAGQAAVDRCTKNLRGFDPAKLVMIGRPPLDTALAPVLGPDPRLTVMYAPTWPGENEANNFSSLDVLGPAVVSGLIDDADIRVVYKPHPRVASATRRNVLEAHQQILDLLRSHHEEGTHHVAPPESDILSLFPHTDVLITDVSSVGPDFLELRPEAGLVIADRYTDRNRIAEVSPLGESLGALSTRTVNDVAALARRSVTSAQEKAERARLRSYYFAAEGPGDSTRAFHAAVEKAIAERERENAGHTEG